MEQASSLYKFTGKEYDPETGNYYHGARYYDPKLSRWISADKTYSSLAFYDYCNNNPIIYIDPDGNAPTPFAIASTVVSAYSLYDDIKNGDSKLIALSSAALFFDLISLYPLNPMPGGAGFLIQTQRLIRQTEPMVNEAKHVVNAAKNATIEYNKSGGDIKSTGLMFVGSYFLERGSSFGALKTAERFLPGGKKEELSQAIFEGVQLATNQISSVTAGAVADKIQNRNSSEKKLPSSEVNPYSIDYIGSGVSITDMLNPKIE